MRYTFPARIIPRIAGADDPHGNPVVTWGAPVVTRCSLTRATKGALADGSVLTVVSDLVALFPPTAVVQPGDRVEVDLPTGETVRAAVRTVTPMVTMVGRVVALKAEMKRAD